MAARTIVTSHPDVACGMCGRRLLRGEQPDVFLGGGQRRVVCELCTPRATHEGWRRETDAHATRRSDPPERGRSLLGRLRQSRRPAAGAEPVLPTEPPGAADLPSETRPGRIRRAGASETAGVSETPVAARGAGIDAEWADLQEEWAPAQGSWGGAEAPAEAQPATIEHPAADIAGGGRADASVRRALEVFNQGEHPRRVAGVARALGAPSVRAAPTADGVAVTIVVAWELCWYRYEIDLGDEARGARLMGEGMELEELAGEDRVANAAADERGELELLA
jgi:hypothetical protein